MLNSRIFRSTHFLIIATVIAGLAVSSTALFAQIVTESDDDLRIEGALLDMAFYAGGNLNISAKSQDDIFVAGGDVTFEGVQADHLIAAGGDLNFSDIAVNDLVTAGGDVELISGTIVDDIVASAGDINIASGLSLGGSAVLSGGDVTIATPVGAELRVAAGRVNLEADVAGDAYLAGGEVIVGPGVTIGGDLRHRAEELTIDPGAEVVGEIIELEPTRGPDFESLSIKAAAVFAIFALAFLVGAAILVVVIAMVLPGLMNSAAGMIGEKPLSTLGIGVLVIFIGPALMAVLFATVFGAPLALMLVALFAAAAPLAIAAVIYFIGLKAHRMLGGGEAPGLGARAVWTALAGGAFVIIGLIPIVGGLVWFFAYMFGMGAVVTRGGRALATAS